MDTAKINNQIAAGIYIFKNETSERSIDFKLLNIENDQFIKLIFTECNFKKSIEISNLNNPKLSINFIKCTFTQVYVTNLELEALSFYSILELERLDINNSSFNILSVSSGNKLKNSEINIYYSTIRKELTLNQLRVNKLDILDINPYKEEPILSSLSFNNSEIDKLHFNGHFKNYCLFLNTIMKEALFENCTFEEINFNKTNFGEKSRFIFCQFNSTSQFKSCSNQGTLQFLNTSFENFSHFNESTFNELNIDKTTFNKKASFDRLTVDTFSLYQTTFNQGAFFDELKIKNISNNKYLKNITSDEALKWRRTLRQIKQELQKAENRIDYNRFRGYELQAYYRELSWFKWKESKDKFILASTYLSTGFGNSWRRALVFTLFWGLFWYYILYRLEHLTPFYSNFETFWNGYYRFLLVTDFYNPFINETKSFLENGWSGLVMIIGKIFIAFGIYEMIQAFRKFKA